MSLQRTICSLLVIIGCFIMDVLAQQGCDKVFSSYKSGNRKGEFQSPGYPSHYPNGVSCRFKFIGRKNVERVKIKFTDFNLQGRRPSCANDHVYIYSQLKKESEDLIQAPYAGPFCGEGTIDLPSLVMSTNHILIIWFYSNNQKSNNGFRGTYEFVEVDHGMPTSSPETCEYVISATHNPTGYIKSPTYPGVYPDNLQCKYHLRGAPGHRIKLTFEDFSLFYGDEYCPFDYLMVIDGERQSDPVINKFCGSYNRSTVIYSSTEVLMLTFTTGEHRLAFDKNNNPQNNADFQFERRGFNISYEFSTRFVKLDDNFVKQGSEHIRGTECDLRIRSGKETGGTFESPSYPGNFPEGIVCRYFLDGLMDEQNLEKVKVDFFDFDIPGNMPYCLLGYIGENIGSHDQGVKAKYCDKIRPHTIYSSGPRVVITLNTTGAVLGGKFVAKYRFITDYGIPGEQIEEGECKFHYLNSDTKPNNGTFNSPRHPGIYPLNSDCEFIFRPQKNTMVVLKFSVFVLSAENTLICNQSKDNIAFYEKFGNKYMLTERFCDSTFPGPYATSRELKVIFRSNDQDGFVGFKGHYWYERRSGLDRGGEYTNFIDARGLGSVIVSPNYPSKYPSLAYCEWVITASNKQNRILAEITEFNMEGEYGRDGVKSSCENVAIRMYNDSTQTQPSEILCGRSKDIDANVYLSYHDSFRVTFVTTKASLGGRGFKISWTEIHTGAMDCAGFQCANNGYCIAPSLKCDKEPNCGAGDNSDETAECPKSSGIPLLHIAIGASISSFFCIILIICGFYHRRKVRTERFPPDHDHVEVRYVSAPTGCNTTDRLLMEDRNDGNNMANENHNNTTSTTQSPRCQKVSMV